MYKINDIVYTVYNDNIVIGRVYEILINNTYIIEIQLDDDNYMYINRVSYEIDTKYDTMIPYVILLMINKIEESKIKYINTLSK